VLPDDERAASPFAQQRVSPETQEIIDSEVRRIVDECYQVAMKRLDEHREQLEALAAALLDKETLGEDEAYQVAGIERLRPDRTG
jgi:cell division protease FtsH